MKYAVFGLAALALMALPAGSTAQERCDENAGTLGIQGLRCEGCTYSMSESGIDEARFRTEPQVMAVARGFLEGDRLRAGDRIVAVNGALITTREGSDRLVNLRAGQALTLRVRRDGRLVDLDITTGSACELLRESREGTVEVERMSNLFPGFGQDLLTPPSAAPPAPLSAPTAAPPMPAPPALGPSGYLGFGIRCSDCSISSGEFSFSEHPTVMNVAAEGPASESGLQSGDVILEVDGLDITGPGGERFSAIEPGDTVRFTFRRDDDVRTTRLIAGVRSAPRPLVSAEVRGRQNLAAPAAGMPRLLRSDIQYEGSIAGAAVEVRGAPVTVTVDEETGELIIRTAGNEIRIRPEG